MCVHAGWLVAAKKLIRLKDQSERIVPSGVPGIAAECLNIIDSQSTAAMFVVASGKRIDETVRMLPIYQRAAARFPELHPEFYLMSAAYATGLYDATVFHSMRIAEFLLRKVALVLGVTYAPSWDAIRQKLSKEIDKRQQTSDPDWLRHKKFFSSILFDLQAISRECRNEVMHDLTQHFDEDRCRRVIMAIEGLVEHISTSIPDRSLPVLP